MADFRAVAERVNQKHIISSKIVNTFIIPTMEILFLYWTIIFLEAIESKFVVNAFTIGYHENISTIFITQNLFFSGKFARSIALNCSHYILMRNHNLDQIEVLG